METVLIMERAQSMFSSGEIQTIIVPTYPHISSSPRYMDLQVRARSLEAEKLHSDLRKLDQLDVMPKRKWANFVKIMESVHGRSSIRLKIERTRKRMDLGTGYKKIEEEIKQMTNEQDFRRKIHGSFVPIWECGHPGLLEEKITENVIVWVKRALKNCRL